MKNLVISTLITLVLVTATYVLLGNYVKQTVSDTPAYVEEFNKTKQVLLARLDSLETENAELKLENDGIFQTVLIAERNLKTLENFTRQVEADYLSLQDEFLIMQGDLILIKQDGVILKTQTNSSIAELKAMLALLQTKPSEAIVEPVKAEPYVVSNEVEKVVAEPVACPKPIKNRSFSYYIKNVSLSRSVAFRIVYDLELGEPTNIEFEANPPVSLRRATIRYLNSLDFGEATAENCSIPFKVNV
tara:strand:+ start:2185 stop:2922 length:738 start_codon:yes stop_codon:yes gene_type:complete